jgi:hypothetical protein
MWNLQSPWQIEDLTLPSVGACFKKWGCYYPNFQKQKFKNSKKRHRTWWGEVSTCGRQVTVGCQPVPARRPAVGDPWSLGRWRPAVRAWSRPGDRAPTVGHRRSGDQRSSTTSRQARAGRQPTVARQPRIDTSPIKFCAFFFEFFFPPILHFLRMWSTLAGWL